MAGCWSLPHTASESTCQISIEMSEGNRMHAFLPDCAHCFRPEPTRQIWTESPQNSLEHIFSDGSDISQRLNMRRRKMCGIELGRWYFLYDIILEELRIVFLQMWKLCFWILLFLPWSAHNYNALMHFALFSSFSSSAFSARDSNNTSSSLLRGD